MSQNFPTEVVVTIEFAGVAKARKLREYFARHGRIYIVVNATGDDVIVPGHLHGDPALRLVLNARMPQAIIIRNDTLESKFSFSGSLFHCCIPMHAIWAAYVPEQRIENGILWDDDVPETIRAVAKAVRDTHEEDDRHEAQHSEASPLVSENKEGRRGRQVGHLRVIK